MDSFSLEKIGLFYYDMMDWWKKSHLLNFCYSCLRKSNGYYAILPLLTMFSRFRGQIWNYTIQNFWGCRNLFSFFIFLCVDFPSVFLTFAPYLLLILEISIIIREIISSTFNCHWFYSIDRRQRKQKNVLHCKR